MVSFYSLEAVSAAAQALSNFYLIILQTTAIDLIQSLSTYVRDYPSCVIQNLLNYKAMVFALLSYIWEAASSKSTQDELIKNIVDLVIKGFTSDFMLDFSSVAFLGIMAMLVAINYSSVNEYTLVDTVFRPANTFFKSPDKTTPKSDVPRSEFKSREPESSNDNGIPKVENRITHNNIHDAHSTIVPF